jgi:heat-inducible transcriptional repressor
MKSGTDKRGLDARARSLLRSLIAQHIRDGEPVGSRTLARASGLDVSAATIRNIMADLEELGLVAAPHTSAGRVPTAQGYRVFVDSLLQVPSPLPESELADLRSRIAPGAGTQALLSNASELLSAMSHFVGVVTVPQRAAFAFRMIDFVPLDAQRVLVILVFTDNEVQNRIITTRRAYTPGELEQTANYLNLHFAGRALPEIRGVLLRELFEAFSRKREILGLLERCTRAPGVRVFIGEESGLAPLDACTVITAPYSRAGQVLGVLGVIGPTRMAYDRVIPIVQATADLLGQALNPESTSP